MKVSRKGNFKGLKVLIADDIHPILPEGMISEGHVVTYRPEITREELLNAIGEYDALVIRTKTEIDREILLNAPKLKWIGRAGAGLDNIDTELAEQLGISCVNAGEANSDAVGEHTVGVLLMLLNNLGRAFQEVKLGIWLREENRGVELAGKVVGIIGYGNTGKAVARKLKGMKVEVLAYDKYLDNYSDEFARETSLVDLMQKSDIITFHVPLTPETHGMFNSDFIRNCAKPIWLLNLSRGKVVKTRDLIEGLKQGKVLGCALDVLENEKINSFTPAEKEEFNFLINSPVVVLTPHIGGWTQESYSKISTVLLDKFLVFSCNGC